MLQHSFGGAITFLSLYNWLLLLEFSALITTLICQEGKQDIKFGSNIVITYKLTIKVLVTYDLVTHSLSKGGLRLTYSSNRVLQYKCVSYIIVAFVWKEGQMRLEVNKIYFFALLFLNHLNLQCTLLVFASKTLSVLQLTREIKSGVLSGYYSREKPSSHLTFAFCLR